MDKLKNNHFRKIIKLNKINKEFLRDFLKLLNMKERID